MKRTLSIVVAAVVVGCGSGMSGDYGGKDCLYEKLTFKSDGAVYIKFMGMEAPGQYKVDGDRVVLTAADGRGIVFTKTGNTLSANAAGMKIRCTKQ